MSIPIGPIQIAECLLAILLLIAFVYVLNRLVRRNTRRPDYEQVTQERLFARRAADEHEQDARDGTHHSGDGPLAD